MMDDSLEPRRGSFMRIVYVGKHYPPDMGGTEIYTRDLIRSQSQSAEIKVVVSGDTRRKRVEHVDGAELTRLPTLLTFASMPITVGLSRYLATTQADIVHIHMPNPLAAFAFLVCGQRAKLVLTHHADTLGRPYLRRLSDPFVRRVMKRAEAIIVTSQKYLDTSEELVDFYPKCRVIPLGIDAARFQENDILAVRKLHATHGSNLVVGIGRLVTFKGFQFAIEALSHLSETKLLIAGDGPCREYLEQVALRFGVAHRVVFLGSLLNEEIPALIKAAKVVLFPSTRRTESFGYVQLEALACGIPVINTSIDTAASEVSLHQVTGLTVPPCDALALAAALKQLLADDKLRSTYGRAGILRVQQLYRLDVMAGASSALYREVMERSEPAYIRTRVPQFLQALFKRWRESPV